MVERENEYFERFLSQGAQVLLTFLNKRKIKLQREDMIKILLTEDSELPSQIDTLHESTQKQCEELGKKEH